MDSAEKFLNKIPPKDRDRIVETLRDLYQGKISGIKLKGGNDEYRIRIGPYRVIYKIGIQNKTQLVAISRRNEKTYRR